MIMPTDKEYTEMLNSDNIKGLTLDQLIESLQKAREEYGNCQVMMSYDGAAGYDDIKSVFSECFHGYLIINCCCEEAKDVSYKVIKEF